MAGLPPLVLSGPSGVGKGTLLERLFAEFPNTFGFSVSHTTRAPRPGEKDGQHYLFVTPEKFKQLVQQAAFIEHAEFSGNYYGTSFEAVRNVERSGRRCILDIDAQGVRQVKQTTLNPQYLFIAPPTIAILRVRLRGRGTESEESIAKRLAMALKEIEYAKRPGVYDFVVINDDLNKAYETFKKIALGEEVTGDTLPELDE